jgi:hypothetical protein
MGKEGRAFAAGENGTGRTAFMALQNSQQTGKPEGKRGRDRERGHSGHPARRSPSRRTPALHANAHANANANAHANANAPAPAP